MILVDLLGKQGQRSAAAQMINGSAQLSKVAEPIRQSLANFNSDESNSRQLSAGFEPGKAASNDPSTRPNTLFLQRPQLENHTQQLQPAKNVRYLNV